MMQRGSGIRYENINTTYQDHYQPWKRVRTDHSEFQNVGVILANLETNSRK